MGLQTSGPLKRQLILVGISAARTAKVRGPVLRSLIPKAYFSTLFCTTVDPKPAQLMSLTRLTGTRLVRRSALIRAAQPGERPLGNLATLLTKAVGTQRVIVKIIFGVGHLLRKEASSHATGVLKHAKGRTHALPYLNESRLVIRLNACLCTERSWLPGKLGQSVNGQESLKQPESKHHCKFV